MLWHQILFTGVTQSALKENLLNIYLTPKIRLVGFHLICLFRKIASSFQSMTNVEFDWLSFRQFLWFWFLQKMSSPQCGYLFIDTSIDHCGDWFGHKQKHLNSTHRSNAIVWYSMLIRKLNVHQITIRLAQQTVFLFFFSPFDANNSTAFDVVNYSKMKQVRIWLTLQCLDTMKCGDCLPLLPCRCEWTIIFSLFSVVWMGVYRKHIIDRTLLYNRNGPCPGVHSHSFLDVFPPRSVVAWPQIWDMYVDFWSFLFTWIFFCNSV